MLGHVIGPELTLKFDFYLYVILARLIRASPA